KIAMRGPEPQPHHASGPRTAIFCGTDYTSRPRMPIMAGRRRATRDAPSEDRDLPAESAGALHIPPGNRVRPLEMIDIWWAYAECGNDPDVTLGRLRSRRRIAGSFSAAGAWRLPS